MAIPPNLQVFAIDAPENPARQFAGVSRHAVTYLRFANQAEQVSEFAAAGIIAPEGEALPSDFHWSGLGDVSIVGLIVNQPAEIGPFGNNGFPIEVTPATFLSGWHVNILSD